jgi:hypothetical protein
VPDVTAALGSLTTDALSAKLAASRDGEIRLTYAELTQLIADAVKNLR